MVLKLTSVLLNEAYTHDSGWLHHINIPPQDGRTSGGTCAEKSKHVQFHHQDLRKGGQFKSCDGHLVDGKTNGEESGSLLSLLPSALLHQSHDDSAGLLADLRVIVLLIQLQTILRVGPECVWQRKESLESNYRQLEGTEIRANMRDLGPPG